MPDPASLRQQQFLDVVSAEEATARFHARLDLTPLEAETVELEEVLGRVLAHNVVSPIDVTTFDRSNMDGFAVRAADTAGASENQPASLRLNAETITPGMIPIATVEPGTATPIATGGMVPRGADSVVMIEDTDVDDTGNTPRLFVRRSVVAGQAISWAGTDIARGETILRARTVITAREIGVLAALGLAQVDVIRRPTVAIISTGNEIIAPGQPAEPATVYDSNAAILAASVRELGGVPTVLGCVRDDLNELRAIVNRAMDYDVALLSGGTSKGAGDLSYQVVRGFDDPGIVAHGVALKPGKPVCLAVTDRQPVVVLPGFPTSAIFTFHEFVAPVVRAYAGLGERPRATCEARLPVRVNSVRGRREFLLVQLLHTDLGYAAWPMGKGSGSVTTFSHADGFIAIDQHTELVDADSTVSVTLLSEDLRPADLIFVGSHCPGLDCILSRLADKGVTSKSVFVGSTAGLQTVLRGDCHMAGIHLFDAESGEWNTPFLDDRVRLIRGYGRMQGIVFRGDDDRFVGSDARAAVDSACQDPDCRMVNRNRGSGTRILIDQLLDGCQPAGYAVQAKSHNAVAAAIKQGRADWGVAVQAMSSEYDLGFLPLQEESYDFVVPVGTHEAVDRFIAALHSDLVTNQLRQLGFRPHSEGAT